MDEICIECPYAPCIRSAMGACITEPKFQEVTEEQYEKLLALGKEKIRIYDEMDDVIDS